MHMYDTRHSSMGSTHRTTPYSPQPQQQQHHLTTMRPDCSQNKTVIATDWFLHTRSDKNRRWKPGYQKRVGISNRPQRPLCDDGAHKHPGIEVRRIAHSSPSFPHFLLPPPLPSKPGLPFFFELPLPTLLLALTPIFLSLRCCKRAAMFSCRFFCFAASALATLSLRSALL